MLLRTNLAIYQKFDWPADAMFLVTRLNDMDLVQEIFATCEDLHVVINIYDNNIYLNKDRAKLCHYIIMQLNVTVCVLLFSSSKRIQIFTKVGQTRLNIIIHALF